MSDDADHPPRPAAQIERLVGVYNAEGTVLGELKYWFGARLGRAHCALCDITHGRVRERPDWQACRDDLPVPFDTYHLDDQPDAVRSLLDGTVPAVVAETEGGSVLLLLGPAELDACGGSPERLVASVRRAARECGLTGL